MLKGTLLYLANRRPVYRLVMRHDLLRGLTQRYVAGEELADGIVVAETLNTQGLLASLDYLGESVTNTAEARTATLAGEQTALSETTALMNSAQQAGRG